MMRVGHVHRVLATCVVASVAPAAAAEPTAAMGPAPGSVASPPQGDVRAEVVLAGSQAQSPSLVELLTTVLAQHGVTPTFLSRQRWADSDLLDDDPDRDRTRTRIWIAVPTSTLARLYFADPQLRHYLVREVALRDGLDELGRERIAQVVESSTLALLGGARGMSRDEVRTTLRRQAETTPRASQRKPEPPRTRDQARARPGGRLGPDGFVGASYFGQWTARGLGLAHGPGLRLGLKLDSSRDASWLAAAVLERPWALVHEAPEIRVRLQSTKVAMLLGWSQRLPAQTSFIAQLGGGAEFTRISPTAVSGTDVAPAPRRTNATLWLRSELGIQWSRAAWAFMLAATGELSLDDTHYDIERDGARDLLFATPPLRPGALAAIVYEF
jgi:hypothetical protein